MAALIQISRGIRERYKEGRQLEQGTLFWQPVNKTDKDDNVNNPNGLPYDEGTLLIGDPTCDGGGEPIVIGSSRAGKALNYRGIIPQDVADITHEMFKHARVGDFWQFDPSETVDQIPAPGQFRDKDKDNFKKFDLLIIVSVNMMKDANEELTGEVNITDDPPKYIKVSGGNYAEDIVFDTTGTNFKAEYVDEALRELEAEKLSFRGNINSQTDVTTMMTVDSKRPHIGSIYLITKDDIEFNTHDAKFQNTIWKSKKGDLAIWSPNISDDPNSPLQSYNPKLDPAVNPEIQECHWIRVASGYTDAVDIDYLQYVEQSRELREKMEGVGTFHEEHIAAASATKNVKEALDLLFHKKAQLDVHGKIPLSQLHDTVLGTMQYKGIWNPLNDNITEDNINTLVPNTETPIRDLPENQNPWPMTGHGDDYVDEDGNAHDDDHVNRKPSNGDYYVVQIAQNSNSTTLNIKYHDKDSGTGRILELNNGDWVVFQASNDEYDSTPNDGGDGHDGRWEKIDNTDRLTALGVIFNGELKPAKIDNETSYVGEYREELTAVPFIRSSHKICIYEDVENSNTLTIAGVRLVDQRWDDGDPHRSEDKRVPRYYGETNTIENSNILDYSENEYNEVGDAPNEKFTVFESNISIGDEHNRKQGFVFGDFHLKPTVINVVGNTYENSTIQYEFLDGEGGVRRTIVKADDGTNLPTATEATITLPDATSKVIGKLEGITLVKNMVPKIDRDGYIKDSTIREHVQTLDDGTENPIGVEIESSKLAAKRFVVREIKFGVNLSAVESENGFEDGDTKANEVTTKIRQNISISAPQNSSNIEVVLPARTSTLFNQDDFKDLVEGTDNRVAIFGPRKSLPGENDSVEFTTIGDSKIRQFKDSLISNLLARNSTEDIPVTPLAGDFQESAISHIYGEKDADPNNESVIIETDVIVGKILDNGKIEESHSLKVTKSMILGGLLKKKKVDDPTQYEEVPTKNTHVFPGRPDEFEIDTQYYDPYTQTLTNHLGDKIPEVDVKIAVPSVSGVLLTSNSRIDGKLWL